MRLNFFDLRRQPIGSPIWVWPKTSPSGYAGPFFVKVTRCTTERVWLDGECPFVVDAGPLGIKDDNMLGSDGLVLTAETRRHFFGGAGLGEGAMNEKA